MVYQNINNKERQWVEDNFSFINEIISLLRSYDYIIPDKEVISFLMDHAIHQH